MFHSFLVRIMIQKDDTDDKVLENKLLYKRNKRKERTERIKCFKFVAICGNLFEIECLVNKVL